MKPTRNNKTDSARLGGKSCQRFMGIALGLLVFLQGCSNSSNREPTDIAVVVGGARCPEPTWAIGSIDPQIQRHFSHTFTVQNQTTEAIRIEKIKPDCGCIVAKDCPAEIPARGSVGIKVQFNVPQRPGEISHMVQVKLGPTDSESLFLKIHGNVVPTAALHASPTSLDFGRLSENETRTRSFCVSRYDFSSVGISKLTSSFEGCTLEAKPAPKSQAVVVSVTLRATSLHPGAHSGFVVLETSHLAFPSLKVPIKVDVGTIADAFISTLLIDAIAPGSHKGFSIYRSGLRKAEQPKVVRVEFKGDPDIQVEPSSDDAGEGLPLWQLSVSRNARVGEVKKGVLRIGVSAHASDKIEVPVLVFVK